MLLLTAAVLKAWPLATGQAIDTQVASLGKLILIQGEVLLALWLTSGINAAWAFRAAIIFFGGAAIVNLRSIWLGETSCGCFGKVEVPPWVSLGLNGVLLTCLILRRPQFAGSELENGFASLKKIGWVLPTCVLIIAVGVGGAFGLSYFQPASTLVADLMDVPKEIDLGALEAGKAVEVLIGMRNLSNRPITILGAKTTCTCTVVEGLPYVVKAGSSHSVMVRIEIPGRSKLATKVLLYLHDGNTHFAEINLAGQIHPPQAPGGASTTQ